MEATKTRPNHLAYRVENADRVRRLVEEVLLPQLGWDGPAELKPVQRGHNLVYFMKIEGRPPLVVRAGSRRWKFRRRIALHRYLTRRGVHVPAVRVTHAGVFTKPSDGLFLSAEDRCPGDTILKADDPAAVAALTGENFARLHAHRTLRRPLFPEGRSTATTLRAWLADRAEVRLDRFAKARPEFAVRARSWLQEWPDRAWRHPPRLCLHDLAKGNVIGTSEQVAFVDLVGLRPSSAPHEIARARYQLLNGREEEWNSFLDAYLSAADTALGELVQRLLPLTEVIYLLRHMSEPKHVGNPAFDDRLDTLLQTHPG